MLNIFSPGCPCTGFGITFNPLNIRQQNEPEQESLSKDKDKDKDKVKDRKTCRRGERSHLHIYHSPYYDHRPSEKARDKDEDKNQDKTKTETKTS